jgi:nicotinamidase/pyrazinamidase
MKALILVDLQNDLMPGGALAVPQGQAVIPLANQLQGYFRVVVATQDWHPAGHCCFAANHAGKQPGDVILLRKQPQTLWPVHCVQNTRGAELASGLMLNRVNKVLRRGTAPEIDGRSGFFDAEHAQSTGLSSYLQDKNVTEVYVMGLATDCEVKFTALDAVALGFKAFLIEDACRARNVKPDDGARAIEEMKEAGVSIISTQQVLQAPVRPKQ